MPSPSDFFRRAPAKINLMLAVTGTRADGFHNLVSLVSPLDSLCDSLKMTLDPAAKEDVLFCATEGVPRDGTNLVLRAAAAFRRRFPAFPHVCFELEKKIPHGAGLGGGSSDAAAALLMMSEAATAFFPKISRECSPEVLRETATEIGSDCALFLAGTPVVMRGRGEKTEMLSAAETAAIRAKNFLIFKPAFGVSTARAYAAMKRAAPKFYTDESAAERALAAWRAAPAENALPLFNAMEKPVFEKYPALPALFRVLRERFGLAAHMSGSGSACFAEIPAGVDLPAVAACIRSCWGDSAFLFHT